MDVRLTDNSESTDMALQIAVEWMELARTAFASLLSAVLSS